MQKDKHSRSGLVKSESLRKQGAGAHNWGSFKEEGAYKSQADADAADEQAIFAMEEQGDNVAPLNAKQAHDPILDTSVANGDVEGNKGIAHSPSDSMSSIDSVNINGKAGQRRMSNVSDEERERARVYREGVMGRGRKSATMFVFNPAYRSRRSRWYRQDLLRNCSISPQQLCPWNLAYCQGKLNATYDISESD